ncbi:MRN complex-interacting protein [Drosophila subpulchrella]|uniref:MRN complex-interacting protein n=1 Tax=Drosophila subpulchrella TaxID=1486046 RepID=UPI0018A19942|nr:MRN complex-interacting protein [Drosophila subpulchrella]
MMSQEIRVLQCIQCQMYQVDIVKKANKWQCKICRQKQNLLKEFFRGSGPECRAKVQQLNLERGLQEEKLEEDLFLTAQEQVDQMENSLEKQNSTPQKKMNKWADYVDGPIEIPQKTAAVPTEIEDEKQEELPMNFNKSRNKVSRSNKRPAASLPAINKKSCSKWNDFL